MKFKKKKELLDNDFTICLLQTMYAEKSNLETSNYIPVNDQKS